MTSGPHQRPPAGLNRCRKLALLLGAPAAGFAAPERGLRRRTRARRDAMALELPDVLDLLRVAVGAGLTPRRAVAELISTLESLAGKLLQREDDRPPSTAARSARRASRTGKTGRRSGRAGEGASG